MQNNSKEIVVNLWPRSRVTTGEVISLSKDLKKINDNLRVETGKYPRGGLFQTFFDFAAISAAAGFFSKLGEDTYDYVKSKLVSTLIKPISFEENKKHFIELYGKKRWKKDKKFIIEHQFLNEGVITIYLKHKKINIAIMTYYKNKAELEKYLDRIVILLEFIKSKIDDKKKWKSCDNINILLYKYCNYFTFQLTKDSRDDDSDDIIIDKGTYKLNTMSKPKRVTKK